MNIKIHQINKFKINVKLYIYIIFFGKFKKSIFLTPLKNYYYFLIKRGPFSVRSSEEALLISRYLIEDNNMDFLIEDDSLSVNIRVVLDIFKNIIG